MLSANKQGTLYFHKARNPKRRPATICILDSRLLCSHTEKSLSWGFAVSACALLLGKQPRGVLFFEAAQLRNPLFGTPALGIPFAYGAF